MRTASHFQKPKTPPGPRGVPYFGSYFGALRDPLALFTDGRDRYGDVVRFGFGPHEFVVLSDPDAVHHVLVKHHARYGKSRSYDGLRLVMGNGLVTSEGSFWKRQRKLSQPAFHHRRLAQLTEKMVSCTRELIEAWRAKPGKLDLHDAMMRLTLRIVGHTLFSTELSDRASKIGPAITVALRRADAEAEAAIRLPLWVPTLANIRFHKAQAVLDEAIGSIIARRRKDPTDRGDLLSMLMSVQDEETKEQMTDAQLRDEVLTLFLAGHETIATGMSWLWKTLTSQPDIVAKLRAEADEVLGDRDPTFEDLRALEYTGRVVQESFRLWPPVWGIEREALEDDVIGGYHIAKGSIVAPCPWTVHRHPKLWNDPLRFDPDRFLPDRSAGRHRYAYIPFGAGPRICIGNNFALMEGKIIVAMLAQAFNVRVHDPERVRTDPSITLRPRDGMFATVTPRTPIH